MIDPSGQPLYRRIADDLRRRIAGGEYPPGSPLPSEAHLRQTYGVGQHTIRSALRMLVADGLIVKQAGAPTRVRQTPPMSVARFPADHRIRARPANDAERAEHGLPPGAYVLVVVEPGSGIEVDSYPADRWELEADHPDG